MAPKLCAVALGNLQHDQQGREEEVLEARRPPRCADRLGIPVPLPHAPEPLLYVPTHPLAQPSTMPSSQKSRFVLIVDNLSSRTRSHDIKKASLVLGAACGAGAGAAGHYAIPASWLLPRLPTPLPLRAPAGVWLLGTHRGERAALTLCCAHMPRCVLQRRTAPPGQCTSAHLERFSWPCRRWSGMPSFGVRW